MAEFAEELDDRMKIATTKSCADLPTSSMPPLRVADAMSKEVLCVHSNDDIHAAVRVMHEHHVSCVVVTDEGTVTGIVTKGDVLKVIARGEKISGTMVTSMMSRPVESTSPQDLVLDAMAAMLSKKVKYLPVVSNRRLVGIVTHTDITRALVSQDPLSQVSRAMTSDVITCNADMKISDAVEVMCSCSVTCLLVLHRAQVVGILTDRDVLNRVVAIGRDPAVTVVADAMSFPVASVAPTYSLLSAARKMDERRIHRLVVMDEGHVCGIVTKADILRAIGNKMEHVWSSRMQDLAQADYPACVLNSRMSVAYVNTAFLKLLEADTSREFVGKPFLPERFWASETERRRLVDSLPVDASAVRRFSLRTAKQREIDVVLFFTAEKQQGGQMAGAQGVFFDLTMTEHDG